MLRVISNIKPHFLHCTGSFGSSLQQDQTGRCAHTLQVQRKHGELCHRMLRVMRSVDGLEGRFAAAVGHHPPETSATEARLADQLSKLEASTAASSHGGMSPVVKFISSDMVHMLQLEAENLNCIKYCTNLKL